MAICKGRLRGAAGSACFEGRRDFFEGRADLFEGHPTFFKAIELFSRPSNSFLQDFEKSGRLSS
jgi:hypothetical protein